MNPCRPAAFKKVVYMDQWSNDFDNDIYPVFQSILKTGVTHIILCFIIQPETASPFQVVDAINGFISLSTPDQQSKLLKLMDQYNARLMISFGGASSVPCPFDVILDSYYKDPKTLASGLVDIAKKHGFHGIDLDVEHLIGKYYKGQCPDGEVTQETDPEKISTYLADVSIEIKRSDPSLIVSHAPQYPYFGPSYFEVYSLVEQKAKDAIDFYNIQYYNNGDTSTYDLVFKQNDFKAAVAQLIPNIPIEKIVVGKSIQGGEVMDLDIFASWIQTASTDDSLNDWIHKGGVMIWELFTVRSQMQTDINRVVDFFASIDNS